jgi:hypothetical protein
MRAFLTGAIIGLTGYTLGILAARHLAKRHDNSHTACPDPDAHNITITYTPRPANLHPTRDIEGREVKATDYMPNPET